MLKNDDLSVFDLIRMSTNCLGRISLWSIVAAPTVLLVVYSLFSCSPVTIDTLYEGGALVTVSPIASEVGRQVFISGGNAFDVAVAVGFTLATVYPRAGNIGGGGFAVIRDGKTGTIKSLDFRETAPQAAFETMYLDDTGEVIGNQSTYGARSCGVPGTVAGLYEIWRNYGSLPWEDLVSFSVQLADTGFVADERFSEALSSYREKLEGFPETAAVFFPEGRLTKPGERFIQKDLAATLQRIAEEGPSGFYTGPVASLIDSCMQRHSGMISLSDLAEYETVWRDVVHFKFDSLDIYSMAPPSSGGIALGQILKLLEPYDFSQYVPDSPEYIHLFSEAARLTYADRSEHLGDPDYYHVPSELLDDEYLASRRETIVEQRAGMSQDVFPGVLSPAESEETTHYSICDSDGNMVAITFTINENYGSKLVVAGAGFLMNNEMDDFSIKPGQPNTWGLVGGEANKIEPRKRMLSSMSPTLVLKRGQPFLITGSPGGSKIITTVAQSILNYTRFGMPLSRAVAQARFHHQWLPDRIYLEEGRFGVAVKQALIRYGHDIKERSPIGNLQMIAIDESGLMMGASDERRGGAVSGY